MGPYSRAQPVDFVMPGSATPTRPHATAPDAVAAHPVRDWVPRTACEQRAPAKPVAPLPLPWPLAAREVLHHQFSCIISNFFQIRACLAPTAKVAEIRGWIPVKPPMCGWAIAIVPGDERIAMTACKRTHHDGRSVAVVRRRRAVVFGLLPTAHGPQPNHHRDHDTTKRRQGLSVPSKFLAGRKHASGKIVSHWRLEPALTGKVLHALGLISMEYLRGGFVASGLLSLRMGLIAGRLSVSRLTSVERSRSHRAPQGNAPRGVRGDSPAQ